MATRLLLIDTCGERSSVALAEDGILVCETEIAARLASAQLVSALRDVLGRAGWKLEELAGVGVVSGPGSFTGVRVGLAAAKALCEVSGVAMATVSRLEVLAQVGAKLEEGIGFAVLDAGRGELFVRTPDAQERLMELDSVLRNAERGRVWVAEERLLEPLARLMPGIVRLTAAHAMESVMSAFARGGEDVMLADANYGRGERDIYRRPKDVEWVNG